MATMKAIMEKLIGAIPQECPNCGKDLTALASWQELDSLVDLILTLAGAAPCEAQRLQRLCEELEAEVRA